jgi:fusion and transport protein UGO1
MEESTRPDYVIPVGSVDGVWAMMKKLGQFRGEGWLALWKGPCSGHATHLERDTEGAIAAGAKRSAHRVYN